MLLRFVTVFASHFIPVTPGSTYVNEAQRECSRKRSFIFRPALKLALVAGILLGTHPAHAIEGYKDIKFGISPSELIAMNKCGVTQDMYSSEEGLPVYQCSNFTFGGKPIQAMFYFPEDRLLRIGLIVGTSGEKFLAMMGPLGKKYGQIDTTQSSPSSHFELYDQGMVNQIDVAWAGGSVALRMFRDGAQELVILMYSSPHYEKAMLQAKVKGVEDDL